jgi:hypothetical protein
MNGPTRRLFIDADHFWPETIRGARQIVPPRPAAPRRASIASDPLSFRGWRAALYEAENA